MSTYMLLYICRTGNVKEKQMKFCTFTNTDIIKKGLNFILFHDRMSGPS